MTRSIAAILTALVFQYTLAFAAQVTNDLKNREGALQYQRETDELMIINPLAARQRVAFIMKSLMTYMPDQLITLHEQLSEHEATTIKLAASLILQKYWKTKHQKALVTLSDLESITTEDSILRRNFPEFTPKDLPYILPLIEHFTDHHSEFLNLSFFDLQYWPTPILALPWVKRVYVLNAERLEKRELMPAFLGAIPESFKNMKIIKAQMKSDED